MPNRRVSAQKLPCPPLATGGRREGRAQLPASTFPEWTGELRHPLSPSLLGYSQRAKEAFVMWNSFVARGYQQGTGLAYLSDISFIDIF